MGIVVDIAGQRFGRLTAIAPVGKYERKLIWLCQCDCGRTIEVVGTNLRSGNSRSCGCLHSEVMKGRSLSLIGLKPRQAMPEYAAYMNAKDRCTNPNNARFPQYGGRGIRFRLESFEVFMAKVGPRPSADHSLDRINNDGHYELGNIRWATIEQQMRSRRKRSSAKVETAEAAAS